MAYEEQFIGSDKIIGAGIFDSAGNRIGCLDKIIFETSSGRAYCAIVAFTDARRIYQPVPWSMLDYDEKLGGFQIEVLTGAVGS